ncbi:MAG: glycosyltransferase family 4 protein [Prevotellaceae bacterium]|nr:glycosyltransferase family 4 protein [Prevotellaceae bacterium]
MRVLIVNTSEKTGGAAVAANRLLDALNNNGVKAKMLVRDKESEQITVVGLGHSMLMQWRFLWERLVVYFHTLFSRQHLFDIDIANAGADITSLPEFKEADVVHLHWINQGMLSLKGIRKILECGKPVVWTMHDIWPATAICHLAFDCRRYASSCRYCRLLPGGGGDNDLACKVWRKKKAIYKQYDISFVACSKWLATEAKKSSLLTGHPVANIPNPIDTRIFCPGPRPLAARSAGLPTDKRIILFVSQRATNPYKGMDYLVEACRMLADKYPDMRQNTAVAILGGHSDEVADQLPFQSYPLGYVNDVKRIVDVYRAVDVFVLPSLSENLPNTIMEAMACGVPCVGFKVGGIPEMIDHQHNGYVAAVKDAADLANGLHWVLDEADRDALADSALRKVAISYSQHNVALKYIEVYNQAIAFKRYKI